MRPILIKPSLLLTVFLLLYAGNVKANDALGADISYECLGDNSYLFRVVMHSDCSMGPVQTVAPSVELESAIDCGTTLSIPMTLLAGYPVDADSFWTTHGNTTGLAACYKQYVYTGTAKLLSCNDWTMRVVTAPGRTQLINIANANGRSQGLFASLNNEDAVCGPEFCNTSPRFMGSSSLTLCQNTAQKIQPGLFEPDGDSLVFSLVSLSDSLGNQIPYQAPASVPNPIPSFPNIHIDSHTGVVDIRPIQGGNYAFAIKVDEFRLGKLIGSVSREYFVDVRWCGNNVAQAPTIHPIFDDRRFFCPQDSFSMSDTLVINDNNDIFFCGLDSIEFSFSVVSPVPGEKVFVQDSLLPAWLTRVYEYNPAEDSLTLHFRALQPPLGIHPLVFFFYGESAPVSNRVVHNINLYCSLIKPGGRLGGYRAVLERIGVGTSEPSDLQWGPMTVSPAPFVQPGDTIRLNTNLVVLKEACTAYRKRDGLFNPILIDSSQGRDIVLAQGTVSGPIPIGFDFPYFCRKYQHFYASAAGWISFTNPNGQAHIGAEKIPGSQNPDNMIAYLWNNFSINAANGGWLNYSVLDSAPNRIGLLTLTRATSVDNGSQGNTAQLKLFEADGRIEMHISQFSSDSALTVGIEHNQSQREGAAAFCKNRKYTKIAQGEAWVFEPHKADHYIDWMHRYDYDQNLQQILIDILLGSGPTLTFIPVRTSLVKAILTREQGFSLNCRPSPYYSCCNASIGDYVHPDSLSILLGVLPPPMELELPGGIGIGAVLDQVSLDYALHAEHALDKAHLSWELEHNLNRGVLEYAFENEPFSDLFAFDKESAFTHQNLKEGNYHYRLRLVDFSGKVYYSNTESLHIAGAIDVITRPGDDHIHIINNTKE
jgi:hypothetical protein